MEVPSIGAYSTILHTQILASMSTLVVFRLVGVDWRLFKEFAGESTAGRIIGCLRGVQEVRKRRY